MNINLAYINEILSRMIEAQYWEEGTPEDYIGFIKEYSDLIDSKRKEEGKERFSQGLKLSLKAILNNPVDCESIFEEYAMHEMGGRERTHRVFELIWDFFFEGEMWEDSDFSTCEIVFVYEPFLG